MKTRAVIMTDKEISLLYTALSELRALSEKEIKDTLMLKTKLLESVCKPATA